LRTVPINASSRLRRADTRRRRLRLVLERRVARHEAGEVHREGGLEMVAAIELVSPRNKDRPEARRAYSRNVVFRFPLVARRIHA